MTSTSPGHVTTPNMFPDYQPRNMFTIPCYPHVKKYLKKQFGLDVKMAIPVNEFTPLGKSVVLALRDKRSAAEYNDQYRDKLRDSITLELSQYMLYLSPKIGKLMRINIDMDMLFKESLITWIFAQQQAGIPPYTSCQTFLKYYGIDENEYSLDAAYKYWQRHTP